MVTYCAIKLKATCWPVIDWAVCWYPDFQQRSINRYRGVRMAHQNLLVNCCSMPMYKSWIIRVVLACTLEHISLTGTSFTTTTCSSLYVICFLLFYSEHRWGANCLFPRGWSFTLWQLLCGSQRLLGTLRVWLTWYIQVWLDKDWWWVEF